MTIIQIYSSKNYAQIWRNYTYDLSEGSDIAKYVAREKFAWPGGYELYAITKDGGVLCYGCCRKKFTCIKWSCANTCDDGWYVVAMCSTTTDDTDSVYCDHCNKTIYEPTHDS